MARWMKYFDGHTIILGGSGTGKGTMATSKAKEWIKNGGRVYSLFLHKHEFDEFPYVKGQCFRTYEPDKLVEAVKKLRALEKGFVNTLINIDEGWRWKWIKENLKPGQTEGLEYIASAARSHGCEMMVQTQYPFRMPVTVRANCDNLICFRSKTRSAKWAADEYDREFLKAVELPPGRFIYQHGDDTPVYGTAWYKTGADEWVGV